MEDMASYTVYENIAIPLVCWYSIIMIILVLGNSNYAIFSMSLYFLALNVAIVDLDAS
jgi:hypothetical protein